MKRSIFVLVSLAVLAAMAFSIVALGVQQRTAQALGITFVGTPGTAAPPATLGPYTMTAFSDDARPLNNNVNGVPDPAGAIQFSIPMNHVKITQGWATWSHGYMGDVYWTNGATSVTLTMPPCTAAFYAYAEPNPFDDLNITATAQDGTTSGPIVVNGLSGATYFGFYTSPWQTIVTIEVSSSVDFATGEFGIAIDCGPPVGGIAAPADGSGVVARPADGTGSSTLLYAALAGAAAASVAMIATGGWFARRRWIR
jgi:hypothetical protein